MFANIGDLTSNVISSEKNLPLVKNDEKIALVKDFLFHTTCESSIKKSGDCSEYLCI